MKTWQLRGTVFPALAVLVLILTAVPTARAAGTPGTAAPGQPIELAESELEGISGLFKEVSRMPPQQIVLIAAGAAGAVYLTSMYIGGGIYTAISALLGGAMANHFYEDSHKKFGLF
jgi:hypothetical protein